jgi:hypothetical protein
MVAALTGRAAMTPIVDDLEAAARQLVAASRHPELWA